MNVEEWEAAVIDLWDRADDLDDDDLRSAMGRLAETQPMAGGAGLFEVAGAWDSTGHADRAVPLYRAALTKGLNPDRRRRAAIQLASSLRNLGEFEEALEILDEELLVTSDELDGAVSAFRALVLSDLGREREGLAVVLESLSRHLPRYQRSVANYARLLRETKPGEPLE